VAAVITLPLLNGSVTSLLGLLWLVGLATALGSLLLSRGSEAGGGLGLFILAAPIGFGCISLVMLFLGLFVSYSRPVIIATLALMTVLVCAWKPVRSGAFLRGWKQSIQGQGADLRLTALVIGLCAICFLQAYIWTQAPPIHADSIGYHLSVPQIYLSENRLLEILDTRSSYLAHNAEMLYTAALALGGYRLPAMIHWSFGVICALAVFCIGRLVGGRIAGPLAALLFVSSPLFIWEAGSAYTDLITTTFVTCAAYCVLRWWDAPERNWLTLAGLLAGFGVGTKLNACYFVAGAGLLILICTWMRTRNWLMCLTAACRFSAPLLAVSLWWFVLNAAWTGNPVFPFLQSVFHSDKWMDLPEPRYRAVPGILGFLRVPFDLSFNPGPFYMNEFRTDMLGGLLLIGLPVSVWVTRTKNRKLIVLCSITGIAVVMWYVWGSYGRMLLPCVPLLAVIAALNVEAAWNLVTGKTWRVILRAVAIPALGIWFGTGLLEVIPNYYCEGGIPYRVAMGIESDYAFLKKNFPGYSVSRYLERLSQKFPVKVMAVATGIRFYSGNSHMFESTTSHLGILSGSMTPPELIKALYSLQFNYVIVNHREFPIGHTSPATPGPAKPQFLQEFCRLVFMEDDIGVYRIKNKPIAPGPTFIDELNVGIKTIKGDEILSYRVEAGKGLILRTPIDATPGDWHILVKGQIQVKSGRVLYGIADPRGNDLWGSAVDVTNGWKDLPPPKPGVFRENQYFLYFFVPPGDATEFQIKGLSIAAVIPGDDSGD
jgi:hypothetical protein